MELMRVGEPGAEQPVARVDGVAYSPADAMDDIDGAFFATDGIAQVGS